MYTAWVRAGLYGREGHAPTSDLDTPDLIVDSLAELAAILLQDQ
jgi:hypothetical protein